jgi:hypothetical protein
VRVRVHGAAVAIHQIELAQAVDVLSRIVTRAPMPTAICNVGADHAGADNRDMARRHARHPPSNKPMPPLDFPDGQRQPGSTCAPPLRSSAPATASRRSAR